MLPPRLIKPRRLSQFRAVKLRQSTSVLSNIRSKSDSNNRSRTFATTKSRCTASKMQSHACCTVPPVVTKGYQKKGAYETIDGVKTYVTGDSSATKGILIVYDIFGFFDQTLQGADILAHGDKENHYQAFMPDFFDGKPIPIEIYPPSNKEEEERINNFFATTANPPKSAERVPKLLKSFEKAHPNIKEWAILGYCWGGKIVNLSVQSGTPFKVAAACHPAMVDASDAPGVAVPYLMVPSGDEDKGDVEKWEKDIKVKHKVEWFPDQIHGFMAARGDLSKESVQKAYERGYKLVLDFYHENWSG